MNEQSRFRGSLKTSGWRRAHDSNLHGSQESWLQVAARLELRERLEAIRDEALSGDRDDVVATLADGLLDDLDDALGDTSAPAFHSLAPTRRKWTDGL